jgi:hypothetical protein
MDNHDLHGTGTVLRPSGWLRYFGVAFLTVWLCGWLVGEVLALGLLLLCFGQAFVPEALSGWVPARLTPPDGIPLIFALFIAVWLMLWTLGGFAAIGQWLRTLGGFDRIAVDAGDLSWSSGFGPFTWSRRRWSRDSVRAIRLGGRGDPLLVDTDRGPATLSTLGTLQERRALRDRLRAAFGLASAEVAAARDAAHVPTGWVWQPDLAGGPALMSDPKVRAAQARTLGIVAAVLGAGLVAGVARAATAGGFSPGAVVGLVLLAAAESAFALGAVFVAKGGVFIRPRAGALEIERLRFGKPSLLRLEPVTIAVERSTDSDGDDYFRLVAVGPGRRHTLASSLHDPRGPLHLGRWLAPRLQTELRVPRDLEAA